MKAENLKRHLVARQGYNIRSWQDCERYYAANPKRHWPKVTLYNNTTLERVVTIGGTYYLLRYHGVLLLEFYENSVYVTNCGGWRSSTTKDRLNSHLPLRYRVFQRKFVWYVTDAKYGATASFSDVYANSTLTTSPPELA